MQGAFPIFKTMDDMLNYYYPSLGQMLNKIDNDDFASTDSSGYHSTVFGPYLWMNVNLESNALSVFPKVPYKRSGMRIINDTVVLKQEADDMKQHTRYGGTIQGGKIADAVMPMIATIKYMPKIVQLPFGNTVIHQWMSEMSDDDVAGGMNSLRMFFAENYTYNMATTIGMATEDSFGADGADRSATEGPVDLEALDRIISSKAESDATTGTKENEYNPWKDATVDRDSTDKFDCSVASASGGAIDSGNDRLSRPLLINFNAKVRRAGGGEPTAILTNHEVVAQTQQLFEQHTRYAMGEKVVQFGINGIETARGQSVGLTVASLYGTPLIESQHLNGASNDNGEIGRMYFIDTSSRGSASEPRLSLSVAIPPLYNELGMVNNTAGGVLTLGSFNNKGIFWGAAELIAHRFRGHGKIRDIGE